MKTMLSSRRRHCGARGAVFLIVVALMAGMAGCPGEDVYLTITSSAGGVVTDPGHGRYFYPGGTAVNLTAEADEGHRFVKWTGHVGDIVNVEEATTTITMNSDYSIAASFVKRQYGLTTSSTQGGSVTVPGEGTFAYDWDTLVNLEAEAEEGYHLVNWTGDVDTIDNAKAASTTITVRDHCSIKASFARYMIAAGGEHTVGLEADGTVVAVGNNDEGQCNIAGWMGIIQVAAGRYHTVGLKADGTVVAVGDNNDGQLAVDGWEEIIQVSAGNYHTVGLKDDGTVVAVGDNDDGQCDVSEWRHISQVSTGGYHTVGLKDGGTVVAVGDNDDGQCDVSGWESIAQVSAGGHHTVGLQQTDAGTVVATGDYDDGQCDVGEWRHIMQVSAGGYHTVGLKDGGTVVATGDDDYRQCDDVDGWTGIIQVAAGRYHTVGLKADGTVVAVGRHRYGLLDVDGWTLV